MSAKSTTTALRGLSILLTVLLIGLAVYTIGFHQEVRSVKAQLEEEKDEIQRELTLEISKYNMLLAEKTKLASELQSTKSALETLKQTIAADAVTQKSIDDYRSELHRLRNERVVLVRKNDSLQLVNNRLETLQEETQQSLDSIEQQQNKLEAQNKALLDKVAKASKVTASNLTVRGVIQRNSGRLLVTQRARRAEMINVRYEINENALAEIADLPFYTQVLDEKGNLVGTKREVSFSDGTTILYNTRTIVPYKKTRFSVSELVLPVQRFESGTYTVTVFLGSKQVLSDQLTLK